MATIPNHLIAHAANWLADQQRDPCEDMCIEPYSARRPYYFDRAYKTLIKADDECTRKGDSQIGMTVPCGRNKNSVSGMATAIITINYVLGYLPDDQEIPSFSWPPEVRERMLRRRDAEHA